MSQILTNPEFKRLFLFAPTTITKEDLDVVTLFVDKDGLILATITPNSSFSFRVSGGVVADNYIGYNNAVLALFKRFTDLGVDTSEVILLKVTNRNGEQEIISGQKAF